MGDPKTAKVEISIKVIDGDDFGAAVVAQTELTERVVLDQGAEKFGPVGPLIEQVSREAVSKTTAQVTAYETLAAARADATPAPAPPLL